MVCVAMEEYAAQFQPQGMSAEQVEADGWISVEERLPAEKDADENGKVLIYRNMNEARVNTKL